MGWTFAVAAVAVAVGGPPAAADTVWPGWRLAGLDAAGPMIGPEKVAAADQALLRLAPGGRRGDVTVPPWFLLEGAQGMRVGSAPTGVPTAAAPDRLFVTNGCTVSRSVDRGATWKATTVGRCGTESTSPAQFADRDHGMIVRHDGVWGTDDGGATWVRRGASPLEGAAGPLPGATRAPATRWRIVDPTTALVAVPFGKSGNGLVRTADGGRTWTTVLMPVEFRGSPARRADGAVVIGSYGAVLVSTDRGATFARVALPAAGGGESASVQQVICDPVQVSCLLQIDRHGETGALRLQGDAVLPTVLRLPALPKDAVSPLPDVVVGSTGFLVRSTDGGATYATVGGEASTIPTPEPRTIAVGFHGGLRVSTDAGVSWTTIPSPDGVDVGSVRRFARTSGGFLALAGSGLYRYEGGRWTRRTDVGAVRPSSFAVLGDEVLVVGERGVVRVATDGRIETVSARALKGRAYRGVTTRGRQVVAWGQRQVARSTDGGRHWSAVRGAPRGVDDLQLLGPKHIVAVRGRSVYVATDGGRRLRLRGTVPRLTDRGLGRRSSVAFADARHGVVRFADGAFRTDDGGRRFVPLPLPVAADAGTAAVTGAGSVVRLHRSTVVVRSDRAGTTAAPRLTIHRVGKVRRLRPGYRTVTIAGRLRGAAPGAEVHLTTARSRTAPADGPYGRRVRADGTFRALVDLAPDDRVVRAWYRGAVSTKGTVPAATSNAVGVPRVALRGRSLRD